tara:strand:- start:1055 stop:1195 length:141 start_codon:yes stop_codon:yes gene_type:complete
MKNKSRFEKISEKILKYKLKLNNTASMKKIIQKLQQKLDKLHDKSR